MSADFLSRLVARAKGTAETARPIVAPLFAPRPATLGTGAAALPEEAEREEAVPDAPLAPVPVTERAHPSSSRSDEAASPAIAGALQPKSGNASQGGDPERAEAASFAPTFTRAQVPDPARREAAGARRPQEAELRATTPRLRPREIDARPRPDRAGLRRPEERSSSAPTVRISIGRVEVRAVSSPEPVGPRAAPARAEARLSLEEYLRPRSGRR